MTDTRPNPGPWHYLVQPSPVDTRETMTDSGLHVVQSQPEEQRIYRGIVLSVGTAIESSPDYFDSVKIGNVLYYLQGIKMGDIEFVLAKFDNVVGWE